MKTYNVKAGEIEREWWIVDAADKTLGRLSTQIAQVLRGKHKPTFVPHLDNGDFIIVTNAEKIRVTGSKRDELQSVINAIKEADLDFPTQFVNYK